jgi:hypothetical protein
MNYFINTFWWKNPVAWKLIPFNHKNELSKKNNLPFFKNNKQTRLLHFCTSDFKSCTVQFSFRHLITTNKIIDCFASLFGNTKMKRVNYIWGEISIIVNGFLL